MGDNTLISWADATWNPIVGCSRVSAGCDHCYAIRDVHRMGANPKLPGYAGLTKYKERGLDWSAIVRCLPGRLEQPLHWKRTRRIFVNSLSDLFHEQVPDAFILDVFETMAECPQHRFQVLTKRPERMAGLAPWIYEQLCYSSTGCPVSEDRKPPPNVWLGVSVEDQKTADERIPWLLKTPAAVHWVSYEPALGPVDFRRWLSPAVSLSWVISGGESGPGARPSHPDWFRQARDQCVAAGVPYHHKQNGEWLHQSQKGEAYAAGMHALVIGCKTHIWSDGSFSAWVGKKNAGHLLDGREWQEFPGVQRSSAACVDGHHYFPEQPLPKTCVCGHWRQDEWGLLIESKEGKA